MQWVQHDNLLSIKKDSCQDYKTALIQFSGTVKKYSCLENWDWQSTNRYHELQCRKLINKTRKIRQAIKKRFRWIKSFTKYQSGNPIESTVITRLDTSYSNWNELTFNYSIGGRQLFFRLFSRHLLTVQSGFLSQQMNKDILRVYWCQQSEEGEIANRSETPKGPRTVEIQTSAQV